VLSVAKDKHAYTLIGRIPFRTGKLPNAGMEMMVRGDPRLRRPYVVITADPARIKDARVEQAKRFAAWLRSPPTQGWIATFGANQIDDGPLFFPIGR
jgi:tungstate transport system substrate-binding protein